MVFVQSQAIGSLQRRVRDLGIPVGVDGYIGPETISAINYALDMLDDALLGRMPEVSKQEDTASSHPDMEPHICVSSKLIKAKAYAASNHPDMLPVVKPLVWGAKVSPEFRQIVRDIAMELGCNPDWLMACMAFETARTFSPSVKNPTSTATGLIQFMRVTAIGLGTTVEKLALMSAEEQLDVYVRKYFKPFAGRIKSLEDVYMAIIWPVAVGKPNDYEMWTLATRPRQYNANSALDRDGDHVVTKYEAATFPRAALFDGAEFAA